MTNDPMEQLAVILPAAGRSARFGGGRDKLAEPLDERPVLLRSIEAFVARPDVAVLVVALHDDGRAWLQGRPVRTKLRRNPQPFAAVLSPPGPPAMKSP